MIGTCRSTSGERGKPCSADNVSLTLPSSVSILLTNSMCGTPWSASSFSSGATVSARAGVGSQTTTAMSTIASAQRRFVGKLDRTGAIQHRPRIAEDSCNGRDGSRWSPGGCADRPAVSPACPQPPSVPRTASTCRCCMARPAPPSGDFCRFVFLTCVRPPMSLQHVAHRSSPAATMPPILAKFL